LILTRLLFKVKPPVLRGPLPAAGGAVSSSLSRGAVLPRINDEEVTMFSSSFVRVPGRKWLPLLCAALLLGCGQGPGGGGPAANTEEPKPEAKLTAAELFKNLDTYQGKWVVVIARIPRVHESKYPDGRVDASVDLLGDDGRADSSASFEADQWAKAPKFEDGVRYEILGQVSGSKNIGGVLKHARVLGVSGSSGPPVEATVTAKDLVADAAKYKGKLILVKGEVKSGNPAKTGATLTLAGTDTKSVICLCAPGEFDKALKAGRGAQAEIKGVVQDAGPFVTMGDCSVVKATPTGPPLRAVNFTREFAQNAAKAEQTYKDKYVTLSGKAEAVADGKIVVTGFSDAKSKKPMPQKVAANFGPDWKDALAKVKVGDEVIVSGDFDSYRDGEVNLSGCWLIPK
jgi:hypothetical protein